MPVTRLLLLLVAAVPLLAQSPTPCTYSQPSNSDLVSSATATDTSVPKNIPSFTIATQAGCQFQVSTSAPWLHILPPAAGAVLTGTNTVSFTIDQNTGSQLRKDQILVYAGAQVNPGQQPLAAVNVTQIAGVCTFSLAPTANSVPVEGGTGSITVTSGCPWGVASSSFIKITSPTSNTLGNGLITYTVAANPCVAPRTGQIALQTGAGNPPFLTVTEAGSTSNLALSTNGEFLGSGSATNQKLTVTTAAGCPWTTYTDSGNWIHNVAAANGSSTVSGSGGGTYIFAVDANLGGQRTGHVFFQSGTDGLGTPILASTLTIGQLSFQAPGPQVTAVLNGASYFVDPATNPGPISPGEIVALFGANLGPALAVVSGSSFGASLGGVQVFFGSTAAPLIYVSAQQINAVVPYGITGSSTPVTVRYGGATSVGLTVPVQPATPGLFSHDGSGTGPGAILNNLDFILNSAAKPAAVGSVVDIYFTGAGATTPPSADGSLTTSAPPFPTLLAQPVTVTIGGIQAQVVYAGPAPGLIAGLTQIDAIVPSGVKSGPSVPLVVTIGGVSSQGNLSIAVQ